MKNCNSAPWAVTENSGINPDFVPVELCIQTAAGDRGKYVFDMLINYKAPIEFNYLKNMVLNNRILTFDLSMCILNMAHTEAINDNNPDTIIGRQLIDFFTLGNGYMDKDSNQVVLYYLWR